jgi:tetratricopeptide (TPR) repeat protein
LRPDYAEALNNRGRIRQLTGDLAAALADFDKALANAADRLSATVHHNRGVLRQQRGDWPGALADFDSALGIDANLDPTYVHRAAARKETGDLAGALADCNHVLGKCASEWSAAVFHLRGGVKALQSDFAGARADYEAALALEPNNPIFYLSRGNARYHQRDRLALLDYRNAFHLSKEATARELVRIVAGDARRDANGVLENCDKHIRINAGDALAWARRGLTLLVLGRHADIDLSQARLLQPEFVPLLDLVVEVMREVQPLPIGALNG